ncbi:MAG: hypothetical protein A2275_10220 [Bacteroidetes bacterium RIFOXYA12_FULL_35_11]|nr:MAG: hypothetical protein A2X01_14090 [Bacteroidetes bacterium GWF2_35_48]OFY76778.1 MAG: hypothetical protein A2275_10220 [Bacteroidetes bacterium RIFOXYA12_FULL_35_11]OFZ02279.1 MAG: hypothetical protein A2491_12625 [Bacteroidetes bacterium RIFOXYC12_FULL_35_7]HBX52286.1 hypothetical protein [Bacteroidales bacterium]
MIQRIQSIFLLLAATVTIVFCFTDFAYLKINGQDYSFSAFGIKTIAFELNKGISTTPLMLIILITAFITLVCIFLYKKRVLQMKLCILNAILLIGVIGLIVFHFQTLKPSEFQFRWSVVLPILALILQLLSYKYIKKDEKLVRSLDRIR